MKLNYFKKKLLDFSRSYFVERTEKMSNLIMGELKQFKQL